MQEINLFPTTIGAHIDLNFAEEVFPYAEKALNNQKNIQYTWSYKTTYGFYNIFNDDLFFNDYISKRIVNFGNEYLNKLGYASLNLKSRIFFSEMIEENYHVRHCHPNSTLSGILYLKIPESSSKIRFYDPRVHHNYRSLAIENSNVLNWNIYEIDPTEGLMLVWPSWLEHEVFSNKSNGRITCVFDLSENF
jgi:uncharacterized protein (TIGR02466 family)